MTSLLIGTFPQGCYFLAHRLQVSVYFDEKTAFELLGDPGLLFLMLILRFFSFTFSFKQFDYITGFFAVFQVRVCEVCQLSLSDAKANAFLLTWKVQPLSVFYFDCLIDF